MGIGTIGNSYLNFIVGTGSEEIGKVIKNTVKYRKKHNLNYGQAVTKGFVRGVKKSYSRQQRSGGFINSLRKGFSAIPDGWKNGKGFGKLTGALKGCGKAMPALFAGIALLAEVPNVVKAVKEKGIIQGIKETGKTAVRLTTGAIGGALGSLIPIPFLGTMIGWSIGERLGAKLVGKSYTEQVADKQDASTNTENTKNNNESTPVINTATNTAIQTPEIALSGNVELPPIEDEDFGPYKPYANVFYNNPAAYAGIMPTQPTIPNGLGMSTVGGYGIATNITGNLLNKMANGGNLLIPLGSQNAYNQKAQIINGNNLNISK